VVVPGNRAQQRLDEFSAFFREELLRENAETARRASWTPAPRMELPAELVEAETVAFLFDEEDGPGFHAEFGLVEEAFADPDLVRHRRYRDQVLSCLEDESVPPMVLRRLADRDPDKASALFRRLLKRPRFDRGPRRGGAAALGQAGLLHAAAPTPGHPGRGSAGRLRRPAVSSAQAGQVQSGRGRAGNGGRPRWWR
jgi:hypothetical protein